jgi:hypothetical protein
VFRWLISRHKLSREFGLKTLWESFDGAQDERRDFEIIGDFPFMLSMVEAFVGFSQWNQE